MRRFDPSNGLEPAAPVGQVAPVDASGAPGHRRPCVAAFVIASDRCCRRRRTRADMDGPEQPRLRREVDAAGEAFGIEQLQYKEAATDLLAALQAQQTLFTARNQLVQSHRPLLQAFVHLFQALGGG